MRYDGLDRDASYRLRVVYTGDMFQVKMRPEGQRLDRGASAPAQAQGHDSRSSSTCPREATRDGTLDPDLDRRAEPRRQRPGLPGGGGVVDQEIVKTMSPR